MCFMMTAAPGKGWDWFLPALTVCAHPGMKLFWRAVSALWQPSHNLESEKHGSDELSPVSLGHSPYVSQEEGAQKQRRNDRVPADLASGFLGAGYCLLAFGGYFCLVCAPQRARPWETDFKVTVSKTSGREIACSSTSQPGLDPELFMSVAGP